MRTPKDAQVHEVFSAVAPHYDVMNDLMSFGLHRLWKRMAIARLMLQTEHCVLDLAGGTGDLAEKITAITGSTGHVVLADINSDMLEQGRKRALDHGLVPAITWVQANAEVLPFAAHQFDRIICGFGLRNMSNLNACLSEIHRVLKPGGKIVILEFSHPTDPWISKLYDLYSVSVLPRLGKYIAQTESSYRYLVESIRMHPSQEILKTMMETSGLIRCEFQNIHNGIVAIHTGYKAFKP
jgi:demethylmenaquinone methyltransferase/2-methoxy-6-polyprenyl-1,4-benzoquinol methylase